jgi:RNase P/RNase MRP subunit p30
LTLFIDLSTKPESTGLDELVRVARMFGIRVIGVPVGVISGGPQCRSGVLLVPRYTVTAEARREAARALEDAPREALVVVEALGQDAARYAAVNKRVDILRLPTRLLSLVDRSTARLFRERGWGVVEASLAPLQGGPGRAALARLLSAIRRAEAYGVPVVLVSDAEDPLGLWPPYTVAALASLSGLPWERALALVTTNPLRALARRGWDRAARECTAASS